MLWIQGQRTYIARMICINYVLVQPIIIAIDWPKVIKIKLEQICPAELIIFANTGQKLTLQSRLSYLHAPFLPFIFGQEFTCIDTNK
jgi:hypothetical protein